MIEIWKQIEGYEGQYEVSNLGNVRSVDRVITNNGLIGDNKTFLKRGRVLKHRKQKSPGMEKPYHTVSLNGKNFFVHKLVASAFIPNKDNKDQVDHIDTDPDNNTVSNLRWVTQSENNNNRLTRKKHSLLFGNEIARDVAKRNGITRGAFALRIYYGWPMEKAVTKPMIKRNRTK